MNASFVFKSVIHYYCDKSVLYMFGYFDISKAFDTVSHHKLFNIPADTYLPHVGVI